MAMDRSYCEEEELIYWKKQHWFGTRTEPEAAEDRNLEKGLFLRKQENAAKRGTSFRGWWTTGSDVNAWKRVLCS